MAKLTKPGTEMKFMFEVDGEECFLFVKRPEPAELKRYLKSRFDTAKRGKLKDHSVPAAIEFVDRILSRSENLTADGPAGSEVPLHELEGWKDMVPVNWKLSIAGHFQEADGELVNG